ncbi:transposase [Gallaecimonas sp. GXIMD4217]|uniref:REP-associated tyrosine transposase n=1 Tax=Gallaecimonas sp. GXIMD4217 TaxID=3131927 RepID=UPI00311AD56F
MRYRRSRLAGGTFFFTVNLAERSQNLLVHHIATLRSAVARVKRRHPFHIDAMVVLPDHLHAVWTLPQDDDNYPMRWRLIKGNFSRMLPKGERLSASRARQGERGIWQRRYWEHEIRDESDYYRHIDYVHYNPVKHGLVDRCRDWPYSSFHRYVRQGMLSINWGASGSETGSDFGE